MMNTKQKKMMIRYLRSHGLQQKDIAIALGDKNHQNVGYHLRTMRSAYLEKFTDSVSFKAGVVSPLVGYVSDPCPPELECCWCNREEYGSNDENHSCPRYVEFAAYAQMEDLDKMQKIAVLLNLLAEVEAE